MLYNIVRYLYKIDTNKLGLNYFQGGDWEVISFM